MANKIVESYKAPRPKWAKASLMLGHVLTKSAAAYIAASAIVPDNMKYEATLIIMLFIEPILLLITELSGIKLPAKYTENKKNGE